MTPEISQEYYNFIHLIIEEQTSIPLGFDIADYYLIKQVVIVDTSKQFRYRPYVWLKFGDNYRDDVYKNILVSPTFQTSEHREE